MSKEKTGTEIQSPEGIWRLSMDVTASIISNQILPKLDPEMPYESYNKAPTSIVNGDLENSLMYKGTDKPAAKTTKTAMVGGMLIYDSHIKNSNNFRDNMVNMTETGKAIYNPTHFSIISAPYRAQISKKPEPEEKRMFGLLNKVKKDKPITSSKNTTPVPEPPKASAKILNSSNTSQSPPITSDLTQKNSLSNPINSPLSDSNSHDLFSAGKNISPPAEIHFDFEKNVLKDENSEVKGIVNRVSSNFVSKIIISQNASKWLTSTVPQTQFLFFNGPRSFVWVGMCAREKDQILSRIDFSDNTPTCHDVNLLTRSETKLDIILGFACGDLLCYDPLQGKYDRLNKNTEDYGEITKVKWVPGSESQFIVSTGLGYLMLVDRSKDFSWNSKIKPIYSENNSPDRFETFENSKFKSNPISLWKLSESSITDFSFSPDCVHLAAVGKDGYLRVINYKKKQLLDVYPSYFGPFSCVCWSGDGKYILTGGKDDLVSVWCFLGRKLVARCIGHESWVTSVAFDNNLSDNPDEYRFSSVGEDSNLILWDFSLASLSRPKSFYPKNSSFVDLNTENQRSSLDEESKYANVKTDKPTVHDRATRNDISILQPISKFP
ncbi:Catabolite repression protein creC [Smittium culicis]|uniref:Catabolite repression protein creC n=1 Tax=Smittium culicis TaxID=133412 RepID=A0A1R1YL10_9FUNG|nr:Catabolite repression protein creC [Smittium culicis]